MPGHESLRLQNFTVFKDVTMEFAPGINIFVGPNGSGKTHAMKILYGIQNYLFLYKKDKSTRFPISDIFQVESYQYLIRKPAVYSSISLILYNIEVEIDIMALGESHTNWKISDFQRSIFIPSLNMISHTRGFVSTYDNFNIDFDYTHRDIVSLLFSPEKREHSISSEKLLNNLKRIINGDIENEGERFYLHTSQGKYPMPLVADGIRKIATLYQLIKNGWLEPGAVLFWDEPETHLSPILMDEVVKILLELARGGVQIFLATHNYIILKEFDLQATKEDSIRYFSFSLNENNAAQVSWTDDYSQIGPNPISEQLDYIYDRELKRSLGPRGK